MSGKQESSEFTAKFSLKGKTSLVTGATGILGKYFCKALAEAGSDLVLVDLQQDALNDFAGELKKTYQIKAAGFACDIADKSQVNQLKKKVYATFARIDVLHNNAAAKGDDLKAFFAPTEEFDLAVWKKIMAVNLDGMFLIAQAFGGEMARDGKGGSIIQTSSIYGIMGPDQRIYKGAEYMGVQINTPAVYSASKAGVGGLTKYLAALWGANKVRVNTLVPGGVFSGQNQRFVDNYSRRVPMARMAQPEEMTGALLFLASDASSYVTGQTLAVDGGLSCW